MQRHDSLDWDLLDKNMVSTDLIFFIFYDEKGEGYPEMVPPPLLLEQWQMIQIMYCKGTIVEGLIPPRCQKDANPLALCWIASAEGVRPLKMTSILIGLEGPKCRKNSLSHNFATECSAAKRPPERLLQSHHEAVDARRLPYRLGLGASEEHVRAILHCPCAQHAIHGRVRDHVLPQRPSHQVPS